MLAYTGSAEFSYYFRARCRLKVNILYIPRPLLAMLVIVYFLFLLAVDWITNPLLAWYRPFLLGFLVVFIALWCHREQDRDEL